MSTALSKVIADLEKKLQCEIDESIWLLGRFKDVERKIINTKETLNELKEVETRL